VIDRDPHRRYDVVIFVFHGKSVRLDEHRISTAKDCLIIETDQLCIDKEAQGDNIEKLQKGEENDIALIGMEEYVEFRLLVSRKCLPTEDNFDRVKSACLRKMKIGRVLLPSRT
jgi:hypothetical protein